MNITTEYIALAREMRELGFPQPKIFTYFQLWVFSNDRIFTNALPDDDGVLLCQIPSGNDLFLFHDNISGLTYLPTVEDVIPDWNTRFGLGELNLSFRDGKWQTFRETNWPEVFFIVSEHENMNIAACLAWIEAAKLPKE